MRPAPQPIAVRITSWATLVLLIGVFGYWMTISAGTPRPVSIQQVCHNNLRMIDLALRQYHQTYGSFPPALVRDGSGKPMHSWRILILPFLGANDLYQQYRFDEAWDGPNNRKMHSREMPVYVCPFDRDRQRSTMTSYLAIIGERTAWSTHRAINIDEFTDGPENTLLLAEVERSGIHWMEPRDLHEVQMNPRVNSPAGQGPSSGHPTGAFALFAGGGEGMVAGSVTETGRVWFLGDKTAVEAVRSFMTRDGNEQIRVDLSETSWNLRASTAQTSIDATHGTAP